LQIRMLVQDFNIELVCQLIGGGIRLS
jgi:hypothetical protein